MTHDKIQTSCLCPDNPCPPTPCPDNPCPPSPCHVYTQSAGDVHGFLLRKLKKFASQACKDRMHYRKMILDELCSLQLLSCYEVQLLDYIYSTINGKEATPEKVGPIVRKKYEELLDQYQCCPSPLAIQIASIIANSCIIAQDLEAQKQAQTSGQTPAHGECTCEETKPPANQCDPSTGHNPQPHPNPQPDNSKPNLIVEDADGALEGALLGAIICGCGTGGNPCGVSLSASIGAATGAALKSAAALLDDLLSCPKPNATIKVTNA